MKCELLNREHLIDDYIAGSLSQEEMDAFDEHCFNCDLCFQELRFKEEMAGLIEAEGKTIFSDYLEKRKQKKPGFIHSLIDKLPRWTWNWETPQWIYATVAVGTVAVLCFVIAKRTFSPDTTGKSFQEQYTVEQKDSLDSLEQKQFAASRQTIEKESGKPSAESFVEKSKAVGGGAHSERYAANFNTAPFMEEMVNSFSVRSSSITVLSPKIGETVKRNIIFRWEKIEAPVYLKILNNQAFELSSFTPINNHFLFIDKLEPGLYYWKLETEEDLLFVGKFFVDE